ncbi:hypothetical protein FBU30_009744 [Linnemannia zychae]|nr:hypothetical protein FBU30_009744 [Linnemannia zychae]
MIATKYKDAILDKVATLEGKVAVLEIQERGLIDQLQICSSSHKKDSVFDVSNAFQDERAKLFLIRTEIYNQTAELYSLVSHIRQFNKASAERFTDTLRNKVLARLDRINVELDAYVSAGDGASGINYYHVLRLRQLAAKMVEALSQALTI